MMKDRISNDNTGLWTVAVKRDFVAQHYLIGGDWGDENKLHSHHYVLEVQLHGRTLDSHGYLVDIVEIEQHLDVLVSHYRDKTLNELDEFAGLNPSIEHFAQIVCHQFTDRVIADTLTSVSVKLWENNIAWAGYTINVNSQSQNKVS